MAAWIGVPPLHGLRLPFFVTGITLRTKASGAVWVTLASADRGASTEDAGGSR